MTDGHDWNQMTRTLFRSPVDGELHATGPIDWKEGYVPVVCDNVPDGTRDDLETTRKQPTCPDCNSLGPRFEWHDDWDTEKGELVTDGGECIECGETWGQNPARKVECPTCGASVGSPCKRPSGWTCSPHADRYEAAVPVVCPLDDCLAVGDDTEQATLTDGGFPDE